MFEIGYFWCKITLAHSLFVAHLYSPELPHNRSLSQPQPNHLVICHIWFCANQVLDSYLTIASSLWLQVTPLGSVLIPTFVFLNTFVYTLFFPHLSPLLLSVPFSAVFDGHPPILLLVWLLPWLGEVRTPLQLPLLRDRVLCCPGRTRRLLPSRRRFLVSNTTFPSSPIGCTSRPWRVSPFVESLTLSGRSLPSRLRVTDLTPLLLVMR